MGSKERMRQFFIGALDEYISLYVDICEDCPLRKKCNGELEIYSSDCYRWSDYSRAEELTDEYVKELWRLLY